MKKNELTIEALTENLGTVTEFIDAVPEETECPMKVQSMPTPRKSVVWEYSWLRKVWMICSMNIEKVNRYE